jgi:hypothetical protein
VNRRTIRLASAALLALAALAIFAVRTRSNPAAEGSGRTVTCELSNPAYSGWCRVTEKLARGASPGRVCEGVLACLNDPRCVKTYCSATTIRGGWKLEAVRSEWKEK